MGASTTAQLGTPLSASTQGDWVVSAAGNQASGGTFVVTSTDGRTPIEVGFPIRIRGTRGDPWLNLAGDRVDAGAPDAAADFAIVGLDAKQTVLVGGQAVLVRGTQGDPYWRVEQGRLLAGARSAAQPFVFERLDGSSEPVGSGDYVRIRTRDGDYYLDVQWRAPASTAEIDFALTHVRWALGDGGPCTQLLPCTMWNKIIMTPGGPALIARENRSAKEMIIIAKAARVLAAAAPATASEWGLDDAFALWCVQSTQAHNDGVRGWMEQHPAAVLGALDRLTVQEIGSVVDARLLLRTLAPLLAPLP